MEAREIPAHLQVREEILRKIGGMEVGDRLVAEIELSASLGVSRMTANKAIQGLVREGFLSREKGKGTFVTRVPGKNRVSLVVVATSEPTEWSLGTHYYGALLSVIRKHLGDAGVPMQLARLETGIARKGYPLGCGFMAINPAEEHLPDLVALRRQGVPVTVLGATWEAVYQCCIDSDNVLGASLATNYLINQGHRNVFFLGAFPEIANTRDRLRGFELAMKSRGLPLSPESSLLLPTDYDPDTTEETFVSEVLQRPNRPTAIVAGGSLLALRVMTVARQLGLRLPEDLSVVAYDDPDFVQLAHPALTTIRQPLEAMATAAARSIVGTELGYQLFDPELVIRGSSAPFNKLENS
jgi:GntR family transcriptional regulator of arabinose operon